MFKKLKKKFKDDSRTTQPYKNKFIKVVKGTIYTIRDIINKKQ